MQKTCLWLCIFASLAVGIEFEDAGYKKIKDHMPMILREAKIIAANRLEHEIFTARQMKDVVDSGPFRYVYNFFKSQPYTKALSRSAVTSLIALKLIQIKFDLHGSKMMQVLRDAQVTRMLRPLDGVFLPDAPMPTPPNIDYCPYPNKMRCHFDIHSQWIRTVDGSCNNFEHQLIGRSMTPFRRLLPATYNDGIEEFRRSVTGEPLPGARFLSFHLFQDVSKPSLETTMMFVFFGQFTDHDLTRTAATLVPDPDEEGQMMEIKCGIDGCLHNVEGLEACAPIPVSVDDTDFAAYNRCLKFVRNLEVPNIQCELGPREQLNQVTHWLDGSEIYGSTKRELDLLRDFSDPGRGNMAVVSHPHRLKPLLPREVVLGEPSMCRDVNTTVHCFQAGDPRVNENAGLGTIHTILVRHHNTIEAKLHDLNPHWSGERLFQETRRIIVAIMQHITFNEWLPLLLGPQMIKKFQLNLRNEGYYKGYDPELDGRIPNEFATAAFRIGHTLLQERLRRASRNYDTDDSLFLSQTFNRPEHLYNDAMGGIDAFIRGLSHEPSQSYDHFFTKQITRSLFADLPPNGPGHDLLSLNIQRGRDHGLAPYNEYREFCGLGRAHGFEDLSAEITDAKHVRTLAHLYRDVNDIDLFVGGVSEHPVPNGIAGPTFACIIGNTFRNLRHADRLWYENKQAGFSPGQLQEIRKITMAKILCTNGDYITQIQPYAFLQLGQKPAFQKDAQSDPFNLPVPCDSIPDIDLLAWRHGPFTTS